MGSVTDPAGPDRWVSTPMLMLMVFVGAATGATTRALLEQAFPTAAGGWPWATFVINVVGSLLLGALLQSLARTGDDVGWRRAVRLGCGTGVLGGFTTYSTFVMEIDTLAADGFLLRGIGYAVLSVILGIAAAGAGIWLANRFDRSRPSVAQP